MEDGNDLLRRKEKTKSSKMGDGLTEHKGSLLQESGATLFPCTEVYVSAGAFKIDE